MSALPQESDFGRLKRWGRKFLADWKAGTGGGNGHRPAAPQGPRGHLAYMLTQRDCWPAHVRAMGQNAQLHRMVIGALNNDLYLTHSRRNLLILGHPGRRKLSACSPSAILSHPGPVISTSTKDDVLRATGLVRARLEE